MPNPSGPDQGDEPTRPDDAEPAESPADSAGESEGDTQLDAGLDGDRDYGEATTEVVEQQADPETEILATQDPDAPAAPLPTLTPGERRFTAPSGMDAGSTQIIGRTADPETEVFSAVGPADDSTETAPKIAAPQEIPARPGAAKPPRSRRSWGWVVALILVIAALVAVAVLGTVLLTRSGSIGVSQEERVKETIMKYDTAIETGDLATLRGVTCGQTADSYNKFDDRQWADIHRRVAEAGQYPVIASVDQVVINGEHAEANVTTFMESDPSTRSTRSLDLQFRDDQWKICQVAAG